MYIMIVCLLHTPCKVSSEVGEGSTVHTLVFPEVGFTVRTVPHIGVYCTCVIVSGRGEIYVHYIQSQDSL